MSRARATAATRSPAARRAVRARATTGTLLLAAILAVTDPAAAVPTTDPITTPTTEPTTADPTNDPTSTDPTRAGILRAIGLDHRADSRRPATTTAPDTTTSSADGSSSTSTSTSSVAPSTAPTSELAVSGILGAPNPFDATHGFTMLSRGNAQLQDGTTVGAVAVGGDLTVGPYEVTSTPPALLDGTPVAVLVGGGISADGPTIGSPSVPPLEARGRVDALDPAPVEGTVAVASPGTFDRAFEGVFADLEARSRLLASLPVTATANDKGARPWRTWPVPTSTWLSTSRTARPGCGPSPRTTSAVCGASPSTLPDARPPPGDQRRR